MKKNPFKLDVVSVRLVKDAPIYSEQPFDSPAAIAAALGKEMCAFDREVVCVVNLKTNLTPINVHFASMGTLNQTLASPRELLKAAYLSNATGIVLIHNHPSGRLLPSREDTALTDRMNRVCELAGLSLYDHIIVGGDNREYFSFREKGVIENPHFPYKTDYNTLELKAACVAEHGKAR